MVYQDSMLSKTLVIGIIALFVGVTIAPVLTAVDNSTEDAICNESMDNSETETIDDYEEIITFIVGWADLNWIKHRGIFRGIVNITSDWTITLSGLRRSKDGIEYYNVRVDVDYVYAYRFIGFSRYTPWQYWEVTGIALGNIEWVEYA